MQYTKEKFHDTVSILVSAYLNDTLRHSDCTACAVGNIIAAKINAKVIVPATDSEEENFWLTCGTWMRNGVEIFPVWDNLFCTAHGRQDIQPSKYKGWVKKQIEVTGYQWKDLAKIEFAFESAPFGESKDDWMFNGLMQVVDCLCEIHGMNETEKQESKALFVKV